MDIRLYARVLWRFRLLVAIGTILSLALTVLSVARVDIAHRSLSYRSTEQWASYGRIFVTQKGFPYGAVNTHGQNPVALATNAILYSQLAGSDQVRKLAFGNSPPPASIQAAPVLASASSSDALPLISIAAIANQRATAVSAAQRELQALIAYVQQQQQQAGISDNNRIVLQVVQQPSTSSSVLLKGRSKTLPIVVFLTAMLATLGLAFVLENLRPMPVGARVAPMAAPEQINAA